MGSIGQGMLNDRDDIVSIYSSNVELYREMLIIMDSTGLLPAHKAIIFAAVTVDESASFVREVRNRMECDWVQRQEKIDLINRLQCRVGSSNRVRLHKCFNIFMEPIKKASVKRLQG